MFRRQVSNITHSVLWKGSADLTLSSNNREVSSDIYAIFTWSSSRILLGQGYLTPTTSTTCPNLDRNLEESRPHCSASRSHIAP